MIQRIQSVWLLVAALVMATLFKFATYEFNGGVVPPITIGTDFIAIILAALSIVLSFVAIFSFKKRKNQLNLTWLNIIVCIGLQAWLIINVRNKISAPALITTTGHYWIGLFIPLITLVLLFLAKAGIRKDEKLVKSLDRLR